MIAAVLAGGASRRFGEEKGVALFRGKQMAQWVCQSAQAAAESVIIIANQPELYSHIGLPLYQDRIKGMGPLSGLHTAFEISGADQILLLGCDMPLVSGKMASYIIARAELNPEAEAVIPMVGGREQGLFAVYRKSAIDKNIDRIERADIQFNEFRATLDKLLIPEDELAMVEENLESFINVNSQDDLARLEER